MLANVTTAPTIRISGRLDRKNTIRIDRFLVSSEVETLDLTFTWPMAAVRTLREDMVALILRLVRDFELDPGMDPTIMAAQNYVVQLPGLRLEDLHLSCSVSGAFEMALRMSTGRIADLFAEPALPKVDAAMEDVFLPLTNLAAYLRAMGSGDGALVSGEALNRTAERIEEFLLIYGGRLQGDVDVALPPRRG